MLSRSVPVEQRFDLRVQKQPDGCWMWQGPSSNGYGQLRVNSRITLAHRYAYERFVGRIPEGACVCHRCDRPGCVNPDHLFLGTHTENMGDMLAKGRNAQPRGERHGMSSLTTDEVTRIKKLLGKKPRSEIARTFRTTYSTVANIANGRTWRWLTVPSNEEFA